MEYAILIIVMFTTTLMNVLKQKYNKRCTGGTFFFTFVVSLFAMAVFVVANRDWSFNTAFLPYAVGFALSYASANIFSVLAMRYGSFGKTSLIISFSLLMPAFYGLIFLNENVTPVMICGLVLLIISLVLTNYEKDNTKITLRWILCVVLAFIGNGMCAVITKAEQTYNGDAGKDMYMIISLAISTVIMLICTLTIRSERTSVVQCAKKGWLPAILCGIATGLTNYLVTWLNPRLPASLLFPVNAAGGIVLSFLYSVILLKEKFGARQKLGFLIGVVSVVLLNL